MVSINEPRRTALICVVLGAVTLAAFWPVVHNDFVNYDDTAYVTENPQVLAGLTSAGFVWAFREGHFANWHPLTWLSHMLDVQIFGLRPGGHHLTNLLLHVANALLVYLLLEQMTRTRWPSAIVAAFFAWHPLHVESVAWVSERKDVLSTFFALLTLWAYARYAESSSGREKSAVHGPQSAGHSSQPTVITHHSTRFPRHVSLFYILSLVFFALGLMSKAMVVTLPCVMLLLDYWPLGRFQPGCRGEDLRLTGRLVWEKIPFFVLGATGTLLAVAFLNQAGVTGDSPSVGLGDRFARMAVSYQHYIGELFWPSGLILPWLRPAHWPPWTVLSAATTTLGLSLAAI